MAPRLGCFAHFDLEMCFSPQRRAIFPDRNFQNGSAPGVFFAHFEVEMRFAPQRRAFFQIGTSKMAPRMWCFVHFDVEMRFAPQRRAIFQVSAEELPPHAPL